MLEFTYEVLSFEDSEWSRGRYKNGVPSGEIGTFPTYSSLENLVTRGMPSVGYL